MKTNNVDRDTRLSARIRNLENKIADIWHKRASNPYPFCKGCGKTNVQVSIEGHGKGCWVAGVKKEIAYYTNLLLETD